MAKIVKETIHAKGIDIGIYTTNFENEFISLTDIAKYRNEDDPRFVIQNWMRNRNTIEFLGVWEELHNPDFNRVQFEAVKNEAGLNRFVMTPTKWITQMNAIGIVSKAGRYGGTYAHSDIAMSFATWISPEFQLYIMKDYRRLKTDENSRLSLNWNLNREISKLNYKIHTDAIKDNLIPPELTPAQVAYTYANEADMMNVVLFGKTAKKVLELHPRMRDTLSRCLKEAGMEYDKAYALLADTHGLYAQMKKQLFRGEYLKVPSWMERVSDRAKKTCILIGSWEEIEGDKLIIESLYGDSYDRFLEEVLPYAKGEDPLLYMIKRNESISYYLASTENIWSYLNVLTNEKIWQSFVMAVFEVINEWSRLRYHC